MYRSGVPLSPEDSLAWPITSSLFVLGCMSAGANAGYRLVSWLSSRTAIVSTLPAPLLPTPWSAQLSVSGFLWYVLRNQTQKTDSSPSLRPRCTRNSILVGHLRFSGLLHSFSYLSHLHYTGTELSFGQRQSMHPHSTAVTFGQGPDHNLIKVSMFIAAPLAQVYA